MKTDDFVAMLARNAEPIAVPDQRARFAAVIGAAALASFVLMLATLGIRHDLADAMRDAMFWVKIGFAAALAVGAMMAASRLSIPGRRLAAAPALLAVPVAAMLMLAAAALAGAPPEARLDLLLGSTWRTCPFNITLLSLPGVVLMLWLSRGLAPTRPTLAGAACGLTAGAVAALVYALHCPEMAAPFVAVWYLLGMMLPAVIGAAMGPRVLRW